MRAISKKEYLLIIDDCESVYLIKTQNGKIYLLADMEYGGDYQQARIEQMNFELNIALKISEAVNECRECYNGGIYFMEYDEDTTDNVVIRDFIGICPNADCLECSEYDLERVHINAQRPSFGEFCAFLR